MLAWGYNVLYFEAFDETLKKPRKAENEKLVDETHWGVMSANRSNKWQLTC